jgi:hypothetical protein
MKHKTNVKEKLLSIAIAIILTMFIFFGINTFYKAPEWDEMCKDIMGVTTKEGCEAGNGEWNFHERPVPVRPEEKNQTYEYGYCECAVYEEAEEAYSKTFFIIALVLGLAAVLLGTLVINLPSVAAGVLAGGILTLIAGVMRYWGNLQDVLRFLLLGAVLAILIAIAYKKKSK